MARIDEQTTVTSGMHSALVDGQETLSRNSIIDFQVYSRTILPIDKFIYWTPTHQVKMKGSLHYTQESLQNEDETQGYATVTFTSETMIEDFTTSNNTLHVASVDGFRFAFSQQTGFYETAGVWHYFGHSVAPAFASQLLDIPGSIDPDQAVVSNSLPLWLGLNGYTTPYYDRFSATGVPFRIAPPTLYPSFMVDTNLIPPYVAVQIGENDTNALQIVPMLDYNRNSSQLVTDRVTLTLYGLQNNEVIDFVNTVNQFSVEKGYFGIMTATPPRDAKRTNTELDTLAMKKVITYDISYYQTRAAQVARQLILSATATYKFADDAR